MAGPFKEWVDGKPSAKYRLEPRTWESAFEAVGGSANGPAVDSHSARSSDPGCLDDQLYFSNPEVQRLQQQRAYNGEPMQPADMPVVDCKPFKGLRRG